MSDLSSNSSSFPEWTQHLSRLDYSSIQGKTMKAFMDSVGPLNHQISSFNHFLQEGIGSVIDEFRHTVITHKDVTYEIQFGDYVLKPPTYHETDNRYIDATPKLCMDRQSTYMSEFLLDFTVKMPLGTIQKHEKVSMGHIPIMVMSNLCRLSALKHDPDALIALGEDVYEEGGYFIIDGQPKISSCQEKMIVNRIYTHTVQKSKNSEAVIHGEVHNTPLHKQRETIFKTELREGLLVCSIPYIPNEWLPISILFNLLGVTDPAMMLHLILPNDYYTSIPKLFALTTEVLEQTIERSSMFINSEDDAWLYLSKIIRKVVVPDGNLDVHKASALTNAHRLIDYDLFPHMGEGSEYRFAKACFLGVFLRQILFVAVGHKPSDDRDHMANKMIVTVGMRMTTLFYHIFYNLLADLKKNVIKSITMKDNINIKAHFTKKKKTLITGAFIKAINTNSWIPGKEKTPGISQHYDKFNFIASLQCSRKVVKILKKDSGLSEKPRELHNSHYQTLCQASSPEGKKVGFNGEHAAVNTVSVGEPCLPLIKLILTFPIVKSMHDIKNDLILLEETPIFINGAFIGVTSVPESLFDILKRLKRSANLHPETSIWYQRDDRELHVRTDSGRAIRPCFVVSNHELIVQSLTIPENVNVWWYLIEHGAVEWISKDEEEQSIIATCIDDFHEHPDINYDYCELGAENVFGIGASMILFPEHNAAPRNTFNVAQMKQAIGVGGTNAWLQQNQKTLILNAPHKPLAHSRNAELVHATDCPSGTNTVIMIYPMEGFNQEDSLVLNKGSSECGYGDFTMLIPFRAIIRKDRQENLEIPTPASCSNFHGNTSKLHPEKCHVLRGQRIEKGDVLIGIVSREEEPKSISVKYEHELPGSVYRVLNYRNETGYQIINIIVAQHRPLENSDKMALPYGNKGTISMKYPCADLPQTLTGIIPEVLINPNAFPSRMSFGIFFEGLTGRKLASTTGEMSLYEAFRCSRDATPFQKDLTLDRLMNELHKSGLPKYSEERVIDGRTGELVSVPVFVGINHYHRLKHLGVDKINCLCMDHEILTDNGWKFFHDLLPTDKVATLKDDQVVYEIPLDYHYYPDYEGLMYNVGHPKVPLKVTLNHRMYVKRKVGNQWNSHYELVEAREIIGQPVKYLSSSIFGLQHCHAITVNDDEPSKTEKVYYKKCPVFCLSVTSEVFHVRRHGCAFWTGNSRSKGQRDRLTQQPVEGRAHGGGQRCGVYERDIWFANGAGAIVKDRMMDQSDASQMCICKLCGLPALHIKAQPPNPERYWCYVCETAEVTYIKIPYAVKLFIQEMGAMGIFFRLIPKSSKVAIVDQDDHIIGETVMLV